VIPLSLSVVPVRMSAMFERFRAKRAEKHYRAELVAWQQQRDASASLLEIAKSYAGEGADNLMLKRGEAVFACITGAALV
jgi:hypothetical protein